MSDVPPISILIMAKNEADKIGTTLASAKACPWAVEVIVADTGSTDDTVKIAESAGAKVIHHDWVDFASNRKQLIAAATHDWVFVLDADEEIAADLVEEIAKLSPEDFKKHPVMDMPRQNFILQRHVRAWDPDRIARLFDRTRIVHQDHVVHDTRQPSEGSIKHLNGHMLHNRISMDFGDYFEGERYQNRTEAIAQEMYAKGKRINFLGLYLKPSYAFFKFFILKGGIMDGSFGLLIAQKAAFSTQLKYARLWALQQEASSKDDDD